ncbi:hypothetical protein SUNI508_09948 [Seiridium unicorne]|uniref:2EXR domain-containing protein n=1 Tax=Seiridium unicorne TaxID=138068 RepID=A0ABR2UMX1_9PEZI
MEEAPSFIKFPDLPLEIQRMIWEAALQVEPEACNFPFTLDFELRLYVTVNSQQSMLQTCPESRRAVLKFGDHYSSLLNGVFKDLDNLRHVYAITSGSLVPSSYTASPWHPGNLSMVMWQRVGRPREMSVRKQYLLEVEDIISWFSNYTLVCFEPIEATTDEWKIPRTGDLSVAISHWAKPDELRSSGRKYLTGTIISPWIAF